VLFKEPKPPLLDWQLSPSSVAPASQTAQLRFLKTYRRIMSTPLVAILSLAAHPSVRTYPGNGQSVTW
jgi:hypothetical protein